MGRTLEQLIPDGVDAADAAVIAVASGTQRRSRLREWGADYVVDRVEDNIVDSVREYTRGAGVDLVIDPEAASHFVYPIRHNPLNRKNSFLLLAFLVTHFVPTCTVL